MSEEPCDKRSMSGTTTMDRLKGPVHGLGPCPSEGPCDKGPCPRPGESPGSRVHQNPNSSAIFKFFSVRTVRFGRWALPDSRTFGFWSVFTSWRSFRFSFCNSWILSRSSLSSEVKLEISFDNSRCVLRLCSLISRLSNNNFSISFSNSAFCWFAWSRWIESSFFVSIKVNDIDRGRHKRSI